MASNEPIALSKSLTSGFILTVKVWIPVEKHAEFWKLWKPAYDAVVAEPELRFFVVSKNPQDPELITWVEGWNATTDWLLNVQLQKAYYEPYKSTTESWFTKERVAELTILEDGFAHFKLP